jgi:diadenosine tetraphosphatase ApaH/serine/threonine PP2A family protein phosphatase
VLNPGSVGQPRDGDPASSWLILDTDRGRHVASDPYDIPATQAAMRLAGLPSASSPASIMGPETTVPT